MPILLVTKSTTNTQKKKKFYYSFNLEVSIPMNLPQEVAPFIEHHGLFIFQEEDSMAMDRSSEEGQLNKRCKYTHKNRDMFSLFFSY